MKVVKFYINCCYIIITAFVLQKKRQLFMNNHLGKSFAEKKNLFFFLVCFPAGAVSLNFA